jgi:hypothetical protein
MMRRLLRAAPILVATLALGTAGSLTLPAAALAKGKGTTVAPPGNSGVSQYVEDVPTVKGGKPTSSVVVTPTSGGGSGKSGGGHSGGAGGGSGRSGGGGASGGSGSSGGGSAGGSSSAIVPTLSPGVTKKLDRSGSAGKAAVGLANATAPVVSKHKPAVSKPPAAASTQVLKTLAGSAGGGGMGAFLPIFLIASLVLVSGFGIFHRRRAT